MASKRTVTIALYLVFIPLYSYSTIYEGYRYFERGAPTAVWLPETTIGVLVVLFLFGLHAASRVGDDPEESDEFTPTHWTAVAGLGLVAAVGIAYLSVGIATISAWSHLVIGVGGLLLVLREWL